MEFDEEGKKKKKRDQQNDQKVKLNVLKCSFLVRRTAEVPDSNMHL